MIITDIVKVLIPTAASFAIGVALAPVLSSYLFRFRVWKKKPGKTALDGTEAKEFNKLHKGTEGKTPRMGGILVWGSVILVTLALALLDFLFGHELFSKLNFLSRSQTWIPFTVLIVGALTGFLNDFYDVTHHGNGLRLRVRLIVVAAVALLVGWWFYDRLDITAVSIPFDGMLHLGVLIIPFFVIVSLALYASGIIDGIDGLSGGIFASIFFAYAGIAFYQQQIDLAAFCGAVGGGLLAFLWFNIPPARFWMTETGSMALTMTLGVGR